MGVERSRLNELVPSLFGNPHVRVEGSVRQNIICHYVSLVSFRESTPPQKRRVHILISNSTQQVDSFVVELTF